MCWLIVISPLLILLLLAVFAENLLVAEKPLARADAIFVFSGSLEYGERTNRAAELFHAGRAPKIILTNDGDQAGYEPSVNRNPYYWEWERWNLLSKGVPAEAIEVLPEVVQGTQDEAVLLAAIAKERNWNAVLLVTSPFHTRRAHWAVSRVFARAQTNVEVGVEPAHSKDLKTAWWKNRKNWRRAGSEYLKFVYYWLFY